MQQAPQIGGFILLAIACYYLGLIFLPTIFCPMTLHYVTRASIIFVSVQPLLIILAMMGGAVGLIFRVKGWPWMLMLFAGFLAFAPSVFEHLVEQADVCRDIPFELGEVEK